jgi:hypothetical protein
MSKRVEIVFADEPEDAQERLREVMHLQEIEGNPLSSEQVAMFEMFEREAWPQERRLAHIMERARAIAIKSAAE